MICRSPFYDLVKRIYWTSVNLLPSEIAIKIHYLRIFKKWPNLKEPRTFNEKINWRKLYQYNPDFALYSDKVMVKKIVAEKVGEEYVIPTLWTGTNALDIPFDDLQPPYVIKVNNNSGGHIFIRDKADIHRSEIAKKMNELIARPPSDTFHEIAYRDIAPRILIEPMIEKGGRIPADYKFFVFHGKALYVQVNRDRFSDAHTETFYDTNWNELPFSWGVPSFKQSVPNPANFHKMIALAEKLGTPFDFVRIDMYDTSQGIYFGEATFYPAAGYGPFVPEEWDLLFGQAWQIGEAKNSS